MDTYKVLEFDKIRENLQLLAMTDKAKEDFSNLCPYLSELEVRAALRETKEAVSMMEYCGNPPLVSFENMEAWISIADKGGCLTPTQLEEIAINLTAVRRMQDYLNRCKKYEISLAFYEENLDSLEDVYQEISRQIRGGRVDDYATRQLKEIREEIVRLDDKMHEKADSVLRNNRNYLSDNFCTMRSGRLCLPVKKEYKNKIEGSVIDKSATGSTLFIQPKALEKLGLELQELKIDEDNEERRILYTLSLAVAEHAEVFNSNRVTMERLDFVFAKGKLAMEMDASEPVINTERYIKLVAARHPLMDKKQSVPLDFEIGKEKRGVIITGPNTGGKTVCIKTVALNAMMAQSGLFVPCVEADFCMNNAILCDIGDGQSISENLSTFSSHIVNVLEILKKVTHESLVIMDELGSGTDPAEGMGIAISILEELKKSQALFLVTTHYPEIKEFAQREEGVINARMTFDRESLKPLYRLVIGEAGESCAFFIAAKLGMSKAMLERAALAAYGTLGLQKISEIRTSDEQSNTKMNTRKKTGSGPQIIKQKHISTQTEAMKYTRGDSVMVMPDKKIGIVCEPANEKGVLRVQLQGKKIFISYKRVKLLVKAQELYPEDYDFSIVFDSVEVRKAHHEMSRKYTDITLNLDKEEGN